METMVKIQTSHEVTRGVLYFVEVFIKSSAQGSRKWRRDLYRDEGLAASKKTEESNSTKLTLSANFLS